MEINDSCEASVIIPAYNERRKIKRAVFASLEELSRIASTYEVIIAEDGSSDGTYEIAAGLAENEHHVRMIHSGERLGRGQAILRAIKAARGDIICYVDADLATDMSHLSDLLDAIRFDGFDLATGSRLIRGSDTERSWVRSIASISYNALVRLMLHSRLYDHQCGFKALKKGSTSELLDLVRDNHWFWDTELLVRGQLMGLRVKEIPVMWREADSTTVDIMKDGYDMGSKVMKLWYDLKTKPMQCGSSKRVDNEA